MPPVDTAPHPVPSPAIYPTVADQALDNGKDDLARRYCHVRAFSEHLCEPLETEDYVIQSMPDCSPTKWHLAHTSWFFETFLLKPHLPGYRDLHPQYNYLFNSYYNSIGERHCRPKRGLISRPTVAETYAFRQYIDEQMLRLIGTVDDTQLARLKPLLTLGLHHEQQHQELMLTDLKHVFASNPLRPTYRQCKPSPGTAPSTLEWPHREAGLYDIGYDGDGFAFDNEGPRHREYLNAYALASRPVTCGEYLEFMDDGGYRRPAFWLSMGWSTVQEAGWDAPGYWERRDGEWWQMTLAGFKPVDPHEPVCHVSYFEADAYARWAARQWSGARLPAEAEWEVAATGLPITGNFAESGNYHPIADCGLRIADSSDTTHHAPLHQIFGDVWEWTRSQYTPYPGYVPDAGALGEYNGKFMCNQFVLRGGSCTTPQSHFRPTYRNFFPPDARWQFTGIRLARDV